MGTTLAKLDNVSVRYRKRYGLVDVDLHLDQGRTLAVLGPSGAGKSTLLKILSREIAPTSGTVTFATDTLREGVVRQEPLLFDWLTVAENVALGQRYRANTTDPDLVASLLDLLGITELADAYPDQISGGQAQRASFARALAIQPDLLLLDEPFSALDPATREELQTWLRNTLQERGLSAVLVTHDLDEALVVADDIVLVNEGSLTHRWENSVPAPNQSAALLHPLRSELRSAYDTGWEPGDEEFSGHATGRHHA